MLEEELRYSFDENEFYTKKYINMISKYKIKEETKIADFSITRKKIAKNIRDELKCALKNNSSENNLQKIMKIAIPIIWPNYIKIHEKKRISSSLNQKSYKNEPDFICIDINKNIDVIEIKNGNEIELLEKTEYRKDIFSVSNKVHRPASQLIHYIHQIKNIESNSLRKIIKNFDIEHINTLTTKGILILGGKRIISHVKINSWKMGIDQYKDIKNIYTYNDIVDILELIK